MSVCYLAFEGNFGVGLKMGRKMNGYVFDDS
jgi:hypothetical protein